MDWQPTPLPRLRPRRRADYEAALRGRAEEELDDDCDLGDASSDSKRGVRKADGSDTAKSNKSGSRPKPLEAPTPAAWAEIARRNARAAQRAAEGRAVEKECQTPPSTGPTSKGIESKAPAISQEELRE
jgi:hypothetical protein